MSAVLALALASGVWFGARDPAPIISEGVLEAPGEDRSITVHVAGAVLRPGLVELTGPARVGDAVAQAGGATPDADLTAVNLAAPLTDGAQVVVPLRSGGPPGGQQEEGGPIHLNTADADRLDGLPGVGPVLAARIVAHREAHGPFESVEDLLDVPGIGEAKLAEIRQHVVP